MQGGQCSRKKFSRTQKWKKFSRKKKKTKESLSPRSIYDMPQGEILPVGMWCCHMFGEGGGGCFTGLVLILFMSGQLAALTLDHASCSHVLSCVGCGSLPGLLSLCLEPHSSSPRDSYLSSRSEFNEASLRRPSCV